MPESHRARVYCRVRIRVLVPPGNPTVEPELYRMAPAQVTIHFARLDSGAESGDPGSRTGMEDRTRAYLAGLPLVARGLAQVRQAVVVLAHGSTGRGIEPARFTRPIDFPVLAKFFMSRGWAVVMPARRGRGSSEGLYDEGFAAHRAAGYTCDPTRALPGADRALQDIEAAWTRSSRCRSWTASAWSS